MQSSTTLTSCRIMINGRSYEFTGPAYASALDFIRGRGLTGAKEGCAEGECGACAVLVARPSAIADQPTDGRRNQLPTRWTAVNSCLIPAAALDGQEVITAEGLGTPEALHPVQHELALRGGSQCGYCTPGFVCSMAAEYYRPDRAPDDTVPNSVDLDPAEHGPNGFDLQALSGNLCRCTGYRPIRDAAYALDPPAETDPLARRRYASPPTVINTDLRDSGRIVRPRSLDAALQLLADEPDAVAVAGCTDWGVDVNLKGVRAPLVIMIDQLPELRRLTWYEDRLELGASLTLSEIEGGLHGRIPLLDKLIPQFASRLIRNTATLGGNLGTGSPIGDAAPVLLALDAELVLAGIDGERTVPLAGYFTGYRTSVRRPDELIKIIRIPLPLLPLTAFHKIAKRRFDDISSVAVGYALAITEELISEIRIGLGGVAATPIRAEGTEAALIGRPWTEQTINEAAGVLASTGTPLDDHRASAPYRSAMLGRSLQRLYFDHRGPDRSGGSR